MFVERFGALRAFPFESGEQSLCVHMFLIFETEFLLFAQVWMFMLDTSLSLLWPLRALEPLVQEKWCKVL
jgi:hypothetical protein